MLEKISILKESGETLSSNIVSVFTIPDSGKKYIITTENAVDPHGLTVLHVSEISDDSLVKVATDAEWSTIKTIMRAIISGNVGSYKYLPSIEKANVTGQYSRDISVSASASKQMSDSYVAGEKSGETSSSDSAVKNEVETKNDATNQTADKNESKEIAGTVDSAKVESTPVQPVNSIFPDNNDKHNSEDEVIPGIAEVDETSKNDEKKNQINSNPTVVANEKVVEPVNDSLNNVVNDDKTLSSNGPVELNNAAVSGGAVPQNVTQLQQIDSNIVPLDAKKNNVNVAIPDNNGAIVNKDLPPVNVGMQAVGMNQAIPQGQIAQAVSPISQDFANSIGVNDTLSNVNINFAAVPSFNPNATFDEVVVGCQELFIEGVKNLVQTMTEKIYRDLHVKEKELKEREDILNQREKMLNDQMMVMMNNMNGYHQMNQQYVNNSVMNQGVGNQMGGVANMQMQAPQQVVANNGFNNMNSNMMSNMNNVGIQQPMNNLGISSVGSSGMMMNTMGVAQQAQSFQPTVVQASNDII